MWKLVLVAAAVMVSVEAGIVVAVVGAVVVAVLVVVMVLVVVIVCGSGSGGINWTGGYARVSNGRSSDSYGISGCIDGGIRCSLLSRGQNCTDGGTAAVECCSCGDLRRRCQRHARAAQQAQQASCGCGATSVLHSVRPVLFQREEATVHAPAKVKPARRGCDHVAVVQGVDSVLV